MRWNALRNLSDRATATEMDRVLHAERLDPQDRKRTWHGTGGSLPDHAFIRFGNGFGRMTRGRVQEWSLDGYGACHALPPDCQVEILTPPATVACLAPAMSRCFISLPQLEARLPRCRGRFCFLEGHPHR
jgi:hypothetical protein